MHVTLSPMSIPTIGRSASTVQAGFHLCVIMRGQLALKVVSRQVPGYLYLV